MFSSLFWTSFSLPLKCCGRVVRFRVPASFSLLLEKSRLVQDFCKCFEEFLWGGVYSVRLDGWSFGEVIVDMGWCIWFRMLLPAEFR